jgi:Pvc16 N-terminal domain
MARLIEAHLAVAMPGNTVEVKLATPHSFSTLKAITKSTISVFLYRVCEHSELRNNPQRRMTDGTLRRPPLALDCSYLITTWGARGTDPAGNDAAAAMEEHKLLGIVMQGLYDHAELSRAELFEDLAKPPVWGDRDGLQIVLESLPIEDLYRIWDSGELAYQLSATYRVRVLGLDSTEVLRNPPVADADFRIGRAP